MVPLVVGRRLATFRAWALEGYFSERIEEGAGSRVGSVSAMVLQRFEGEGDGGLNVTLSWGPHGCRRLTDSRSRDSRCQEGWHKLNRSSLYGIV